MQIRHLLLAINLWLASVLSRAPILVLTDNFSVLDRVMMVLGLSLYQFLIDLFQFMPDLARRAQITSPPGA